MIEFLCVCGAAFEVADDKAGCKAKCRLCGADLLIPQKVAPELPHEAPLLLSRPVKSFSPPPPAAPVALLESLKDCITYPFRGLGWAIILGGTIAYWVMAFFGGFVPYIGFTFPGAVQLYISIYLLHIIGDSAKGESIPPDWPDLGRTRSELLKPLLLGVGAIAWAFFPLFLANALLTHPWQTSDPLAVLAIFDTSMEPESSLAFAVRALALGFGLAMLPMNLVAVAVRDSLGGLSPTVVLPAIVRCRQSYWVSVACLACIYLAGNGVKNVMRVIPILGFLTATPLFIYFGMVQSRLLGLIYHRNAARLKWFD